MVFAQVLQQGIRLGQVPDFFGLEQRGQALLPKRVRPLDFAFCLRRGGKTQGDLVKVQRGGQLRMGLWSVGEKEAVIIDVEAQWQADRLKGVAEKLQVSGQSFPRVQPSPGDTAAMVINELQQRGLPVLAGQPPVRRSIVLPELAHSLGLPAPNRSRLGLGLLGHPIVLEGKTAHVGPVGFELEAAQQLRSNETVGARGSCLEQLANQGLNMVGPGLAVIAAGNARRP